MPKVTAIILAAGSGRRMNAGGNKLLIRIGSMTVLERTLAPFLSAPEIDSIIVAASADDYKKITSITDNIAADINIITVPGGDTRQKSVRSALAYVSEDCEIVLIHDGARPFVTQETIAAVIRGAKQYGAAVPALPLTDTIKRVDGTLILSTPSRSDFVSVQTPQGFEREKIVYAYAVAGEGYTDDSSIYERYIGDVHTVPGSVENIKITYPSDLARFAPLDYRTGIGYDVHKLAMGRRLILGGVEIPHDKGLLGHSDADCLLHAVMDALLTAAGLKDIGHYFPDKDDKYKDISSMVLLTSVMELVNKAGYKVSSVSAMILAEKPRLAAYLSGMKNNLSKALDISEDRIGLAVTTTEGLGIIGGEAGIAAYATVALKAD